MRVPVHAIARADRALFLVLAVILATVSAGVSASVSGASRSTGLPTDIVAPAVTVALSPYDLSPNPVGPKSISDESIAVIAKKQLLSEYGCLAQVMYYEARGEGPEGEKAVAEVVLHRLKNGDHGKTLCAVVYQGAAGTYCQFSFACDGSLNKPKEAEPWRQAQILAARILVLEAALTETTGGATFYHATSVMPRWAKQLTRVAQIGSHIFYRQPSSDPHITSGLRGPL